MCGLKARMARTPLSGVRNDSQIQNFDLVVIKTVGHDDGGYRPVIAMDYVGLGIGFRNPVADVGLSCESPFEPFIEIAKVGVSFDFLVYGLFGVMTFDDSARESHDILFGGIGRVANGLCPLHSSLGTASSRDAHMASYGISSPISANSQMTSWVLSLMPIAVCFRQTNSMA